MMYNKKLKIFSVSVIISHQVLSYMKIFKTDWTGLIYQTIVWITITIKQKIN